jgi:IclR family mhp operon transcriptional activator
MAMPSFKPVIALTRGLEILRVVNQERQATIRAIHAATGLDKATIVRMLETLEHEGYVMRDPDQAIYSPTGRTLVLSQGFDQHLWIGRTAESIMNEFRKRIGWPSDLAIFDRDAMILVRSTRDEGPLSMNRRTGFRAPILATSLGLAYLAFCGDEEREQIIATLAANPSDWNDLARHPRKLKTVLETVRQQGYATMSPDYSKREFSATVWAIGAPIMSAGRIFGTINIMMLRSAVTPQMAEEKLVGPLKETADELARALSAQTGRG